MHSILSGLDSLFRLRGDPKIPSAGEIEDLLHVCKPPGALLRRLGSGPRSTEDLVLSILKLPCQRPNLDMGELTAENLEYLEKKERELLFQETAKLATTMRVRPDVPSNL
jgi:hypothetical protein